jgi:hypothetical protein
MEPLQDRAQELDDVAARLLVEAYVAREEAEGAARAIGMAERNEPWQPFDLDAEARALFWTGRTARLALGTSLFGREFSAPANSAGSAAGT